MHHYRIYYCDTSHADPAPTVAYVVACDEQEAVERFHATHKGDSLFCLSVFGPVQDTSQQKGEAV